MGSSNRWFLCRFGFLYGDAGLETGIIYRHQAVIPPPSTFSVTLVLISVAQEAFLRLPFTGVPAGGLSILLGGYEQQVLSWLARVLDIVSACMASGRDASRTAADGHHVPAHWPGPWTKIGMASIVSATLEALTPFGQR